MSFLGNLVNSIGTSRTPAPPKSVQKPPTSQNATSANLIQKPKPVPTSISPLVAGSKRKYDERDVKPTKPAEGDSKITRPLDRTARPNTASIPSSKLNQRPVPAVAINGNKPAASQPVANTSSAPPTVSTTKPAPKGSYAQMLARAKEAQQARSSNPLGTIKHQATSKEKVSKLAERRKQEQEKLKAGNDKKSEKIGSTAKGDQKRGASPVKQNSHAKVARAPRPPLHAPQSSYKGTMGKAAKKPREERLPKRSRYDDYLGTDEEDNSEDDGYGDEDDGYGYGSDASSEDMEAGMEDIDMEEKAALRAAMLDDAKEAEMENAHKREKEARRRKLEAMANKRR